MGRLIVIVCLAGKHIHLLVTRVSPSPPTLLSIAPPPLPFFHPPKLLPLPVQPPGFFLLGFPLLRLLSLVVGQARSLDGCGAHHRVEGHVRVCRDAAAGSD